MTKERESRSSTNKPNKPNSKQASESRNKKRSKTSNKYRVRELSLVNAESILSENAQISKNPLSDHSLVHRSCSTNRCRSSNARATQAIANMVKPRRHKVNSNPTFFGLSPTTSSYYYDYADCEVEYYTKHMPQKTKDAAVSTPSLLRSENINETNMDTKTGRRDHTGDRHAQSSKVRKSPIVFSQNICSQDQIKGESIDKRIGTPEMKSNIKKLSKDGIVMNLGSTTVSSASESVTSEDVKAKFTKGRHISRYPSKCGSDEEDSEEDDSTLSQSDDGSTKTNSTIKDENDKREKQDKPEEDKPAKPTRRDSNDSNQNSVLSFNYDPNKPPPLPPRLRALKKVDSQLKEDTHPPCVPSNVFQFIDLGSTDQEESQYHSHVSGVSLHSTGNTESQSVVSDSRTIDQKSEVSDSATLISESQARESVLSDASCSTVPTVHSKTKTRNKQRDPPAPTPPPRKSFLDIYSSPPTGTDSLSTDTEATSYCTSISPKSSKSTPKLVETPTAVFQLLDIKQSDIHPSCIVAAQEMLLELVEETQVSDTKSKVYEYKTDKSEKSLYRENSKKRKKQKRSKEGNSSQMSIPPAQSERRTLMERRLNRRLRLRSREIKFGEVNHFLGPKF